MKNCNLSTHVEEATLKLYLVKQTILFSVVKLQSGNRSENNQDSQLGDRIKQHLFIYMKYQYSKLVRI